MQNKYNFNKAINRVLRLAYEREIKQVDFVEQDVTVCRQLCLSKRLENIDVKSAFQYDIWFQWYLGKIHFFMQLPKKY